MRILQQTIKKGNKISEQLKYKKYSKNHKYFLYGPGTKIFLLSSWVYYGKKSGMSSLWTDFSSDTESVVYLT